MNYLILVRHGQSIWNLEKKFTGWVDVDLNENGKNEAKKAAKLIKEKDINIDLYYSSLQLRAKNTLTIIQEELMDYKNVKPAWQLNERHYGSLTGLNKDEMKKKLGEEKVHQFRRSWDLRPEPLDKSSPYHPLNIKIYSGKNSFEQIIESEKIDVVLTAVVGYSGLIPTINAIKNGKKIALANKETLVVAGELITRLSLEYGAEIIPVDSEHSAIFQCLVGEEKNPIEKNKLTASGGPFTGQTREELISITKEQALKHPNWSMGAKITIDSASLMNKGLEVIEAKWLFNLTKKQIDVVVHPQSIIHSAIQFEDGSIKAQLGTPNMKIPIQYALTYPRHSPSNWERLDFTNIDDLTFEAPNLERFPCIALAYKALNKKGSASAVLNFANDYSVFRFLKEEIKFIDIPKIIDFAIDNHQWIENPNLNDLKKLDLWTKDFVKNYDSVSYTHLTLPTSDQV